MTEENNLKNIEDSIDLPLNKGRENRLKIMDYFNKLISLADKDNAKPIDDQYVDRPSLYENIKSRIIDLKDYLRTDYSLEHYSLLIYELLFVGKNDFNYDKFDMKCKTFKLILDILLRKSDLKSELEYMGEVKNEKKVWESLIDLMIEKMQASAVLFCAFLEYYETKEQIIAFLLDMLQGINDYTIKINFKLQNLDEKEENIAQDFFAIYNDEIEYFQIDYKDNHIVKTPLGEEEIIKAQEEEIGNQFWNGKISDLIQEIPQENIGVDYDDKKKDEGKGIAKNIELDIKGEEEKAKISDGEKNIKNKLEQGVFRANETEMTENMVSSNDINMADNKESNKEIQELKGIITKMSNAISKLMDENKKQHQDISKMGKEISYLKKENRIQSNLLLKSKEIRNKDKAVYRQAIRELNEKITNVQDDLNLIKARDAIKSFIDYFYKGFGLNGDFDYRDKASSIATQLNFFNDYKKYDIELINTLRILLIEGGKKIYEGNDLAHNIAISSDLLLRLFKTINSSLECDKLISKLSPIKGDTIIMNSIKNRKDNYNNKQKLEEREKIIYSSLNKMDIISVFELEKNK